MTDRQAGGNGFEQQAAPCFYPEDAAGHAHEVGEGSPHWVTASEGWRELRRIREEYPGVQIKLAREPKPCWTLSCAGCGEPYFDDWTCHFPSREDALDAIADDWTIRDDLPYCGWCPESVDEPVTSEGVPG